MVGIFIWFVPSIEKNIVSFIYLFSSQKNPFVYKVRKKKIALLGLILIVINQFFAWMDISYPEIMEPISNFISIFFFFLLFFAGSICILQIGRVLGFFWTSLLLKVFKFDSNYSNIGRAELIGVATFISSFLSFSILKDSLSLNIYFSICTVVIILIAGPLLTYYLWQIRDSGEETFESQDLEAAANIFSSLYGIFNFIDD